MTEEVEQGRVAPGSEDPVAPGSAAAAPSPDVPPGRARAELSMPDGRMVYVDMPSNINADELCAVVAWLLGPAKQQLDASRREAEPARQPTRRLWVPQ